MEIVSYRPGHAEALAGIWHRAWNAAVPEIAAGGPTYEQMLARFHAEAGGRWDVLVASAGDVPVGFAAIVPADGQLDQLMIDLPFQGRGIGTALLDAVKARLPDGIWLRSAMANTPAHRFYEGHGFVRAEIVHHATRGFAVGVFRWRP